MLAFSMLGCSFHPLTSHENGPYRCAALPAPYGGGGGVTCAETGCAHDRDTSESIVRFKSIVRFTRRVGMPSIPLPIYHAAALGQPSNTALCVAPQASVPPPRSTSALPRPPSWFGYKVTVSIRRESATGHARHWAALPPPWLAQPCYNFLMDNNLKWPPPSQHQGAEKGTLPGQNATQRTKSILIRVPRAAAATAPRIHSCVP